MGNLYEASIKKRFMASAKNDRPYRWLFDKSYEFESKFGKDISNFNKEELLEFLASRKMSIESLRVNISYIKSYINWTYENNIKASKRNAANEITDVDLTRISKTKRSILHVDEIYEIVGLKERTRLLGLKNKQDQLLVYLLFIGVRGDRASELINLRFKHIDFENRLIKLSDLDPYRKDIKINQFCVDLIKDVKAEQEYVRYMDETNAGTTNIKEDYDLDDSDFIFRKSKVGKKSTDPRITYSTITRRLQTLSKYTGLQLTMNTIETSGITYIAKKIRDAGYELKRNNPVVVKSIFERFNVNDTQNSQNNLLFKIRKDLLEMYPEDQS